MTKWVAQCHGVEILHVLIVAFVGLTYRTVYCLYVVTYCCTVILPLSQFVPFIALALNGKTEMCILLLFVCFFLCLSSWLFGWFDNRKGIHCSNFPKRSVLETWPEESD